MSQPKVVCGFPGVGKTNLFNKLATVSVIRVTDSDSSQFPKEHFPQNYIEHIQKLIQDGVDLIQVSSHDHVRAALTAAGIAYTLVFPDKECKLEYLARYAERGSPEAFIKLLDTNWDAWVDGCVLDENAESKFSLAPRTYISDIIPALTE